MKRYALFTILLLVLLSSCEEKREKPSDSVAITGKIIAMEGIVTVGGEEAREGSVVRDGDIIKTDEASYCEIQFLGSNIIRVFEDSIIRLSFDDAELNLDRGAAAAILRNIGSLIRAMDHSFSIKSGTVVAGVRGTSFFVKREDAVTTYFCLCNGKIDMKDREERFSLPMESSHHNAVRISESKGQLEVSKAPLLYHNDKDMEALAARIGQTIDWGEVEGYGSSY